MVWVKTFLMTILVPGVAVFLIPYLIERPFGLSLTTNLWLRVLGFLLIGLGTLSFCWVSQVFARKGKGTPAPFDPPKQFVATGLYRYVRNPMYVGAITVVVGESILFSSLRLLGYAAFIFIALHVFVAVYEEKNLLARFGDPYEKYLRSVPRWIPRIPKK